MTKHGLIFDWPGRHHLHLLLPATILVAFAAHAGLFFLFSIIYPRPDAGAINARSVFIVLPGTKESARLSVLLESADPSVMAPGRGLPTAGAIAGVEYTPRYAEASPLLEGMPATDSRTTLPPMATGPVMGKAGRRAAAGATASPAITKLRADGGLAARLPELPEKLKSLSPADGTLPEAATFLVGVRPDGTVAHLFPQQGSGSPEFDQQSAAVVRSLRFLPGTEDPAWGILTLEWGAP